MKRLFLIFIFITSLFGEDDFSLNFGVTSVAIKQDARNIFKLTHFLTEKSGIKINTKFAKSYDEMKQMLEKREVDFAYVCGATYLEAKDSANLEVLLLPYFNNAPFYNSLVITKIDSDATSLISFKNKTYAFSDPKSNSGSIVPRYELLKLGEDYRRFFKEVIYTYDHSESIDAVAEGYVDGASVDSLIYESYRLLKPNVVNKIKIVDSFGPFQSTPVVIRKNISDTTKVKLFEAFKLLDKDVEGREILKGFGVSSFDIPNKIDFSDIQNMVEVLEKMNE